MAQTHKFVTIDSAANKYVSQPFLGLVQADLDAINNSIGTINTNLSNYYTKTEVDTALATKANASALTALTTRVSTAESNITSITGRVTTAESNITSIGGRVTTIESDYVKKADISSVYKAMGSVPTYADLLLIAIATLKPGHVYNVVATDMNYVYIGNGTTNTAADWDALGSSTTGYVTDASLTSTLNNYYTKTAADAKFVDDVTVTNNTGFVARTETNGIINLNFAGLTTTLNTYYTKAAADAKFVDDVTVSNNAGIVVRTEATGIINLNFSGLATTLGDIDTAIDDITSDVADNTANIVDITNQISQLNTGSVSGATFNSTPVAKTGSTLNFVTVEINSAATSMTNANLNTLHGAKPIGFMLYCTNTSLMTKYVKISATQWAVEPIFLAV